MNNKKITAKDEIKLEIHQGSNSLVVSKNGNVTFNSEFGKLHSLNLLSRH